MENCMYLEHVIQNSKKVRFLVRLFCNKLAVSCLPEQSKSVRKFQRVLISKRLLFNKVTIMPKVQSPKLKGALCSIPVEHVDVSSLLPRTAYSNGLVTVKLKKKLKYKGPVLFEPVRTRFLIDLLSYLKRVNYFYKDITIVSENIPQNLQSIVGSNEGCESLTSYLLSHLNEPIEINLISLHEEGVDDNLETAENPLDTFRIASNEVTLISNFSNMDTKETIISIAPGEGQRAMSVPNDYYCEECTHSHLLPNCKFGYKVQIYLYLNISISAF